jgi:hypothetical protein
MAAKKVPFHRPDINKPLPDFEIDNPDDNKVDGSGCCACINEDSTWCNPESPNGFAAVSSAWGGFLVALITGK